jgi:hypothetical protein
MEPAVSLVGYHRRRGIDDKRPATPRTVRKYKLPPALVREVVQHIGGVIDRDVLLRNRQREALTGGGRGIGERKEGRSGNPGEPCERELSDADVS